jgi:hypothetical protein
MTHPAVDVLLRTLGGVREWQNGHSKPTAWAPPWKGTKVEGRWPGWPDEVLQFELASPDFCPAGNGNRRDLPHWLHVNGFPARARTMSSVSVYTLPQSQVSVGMAAGPPAILVKRSTWKCPQGYCGARRAAKLPKTSDAQQSQWAS